MSPVNYTPQTEDGYPVRPMFWWDGIAELDCTHVRRIVLSWDDAEVPEKLGCTQCAQRDGSTCVPESRVVRFGEWL